MKPYHRLVSWLGRSHPQTREQQARKTPQQRRRRTQSLRACFLSRYRGCDVCQHCYKILLLTELYSIAVRPTKGPFICITIYNAHTQLTPTSLPKWSISAFVENDSAPFWGGLHENEVDCACFSQLDSLPLRKYYVRRKGGPRDE